MDINTRARDLTKKLRTHVLVEDMVVESMFENVYSLMLLSVLLVRYGRV